MIWFVHHFSTKWVNLAGQEVKLISKVGHSWSTKKKMRINLQKNLPKNLTADDDLKKCQHSFWLRMFFSFRGCVGISCHIVFSSIKMKIVKNYWQKQNHSSLEWRRRWCYTSLFINATTTDTSCPFRETAIPRNMTIKRRRK